MSRLSITEAAKKLGLTRQRVHQLYKAGKFPTAVKESIGDVELIRIPESEVQALLQAEAERKGA